jgi:Bacterial Ig-like domain (group 1)
MTMTLERRLRSLAVVFTAAVTACGGDLTLPDTSGAGLELSKVGGDNQTGAVGEALPDPLVVKVVASGGQPVAGRAVAFILPEGESGRLEPDTAITNNSGEALSQWVLGTEPGEHQVEARLVSDLAEPPAALFEASAIPAAPDTIRALSALLQPGRRGETLERPLIVVVVDRFGNPVSGIEVTWEVTAGEGSTSVPTTPTGVDGTASVLWTLGGRIGVHKATASVPGITGSPVTFSATVLF